MKLAITLTTYNRPHLTWMLLERISLQARILGHDLSFFVIDDHSDIGKHIYDLYENTFIGFPIYIAVNEENQGKSGHWKTVNRILEFLKARDFDYVVYLQDDLDPIPTFLRSLIDQYEAIDDPDKVCLNYVLEESRNGVQCWTPGQPERVNYNGYDLWKVGWVELHFIANRKFFEALDWKVEKPRRPFGKDKSKLSSGVGDYISHKLYDQGLGMYQVTKSLARHGHVPSLMNPEERKINPLRSI
ncbi:MAG: glycosyltransferase family 2 protein [Bacteroidota bacterium]